MKLKKENFIKMEVDRGMLYKYVCNETEFYLLVEGKGSRKKISVFKGSFVDRAEEFKTEDSLEAWSKFEEMLKVCEPQQGSSGGFKKNPQETPDILPLLAVKQQGDMFNAILFGQVTTGEQIVAYDFNVSAEALEFPFPIKVFTADWSNEEIPALVKCEVILKLFPDVKFKEDEERDVFLFIPKSIVQQGGQKGGEPTNEDGEPKQGKGKPKDDDGGTPPPDIDDDDNRTPPTNGGQGREKIPDPNDDDGGDDVVRPIDYPEAIRVISEITNTQPSVLTSIRKPRVLESILSTNDFSAIKRRLNLPENTTQQQLSQQIINSITS